MRKKHHYVLRNRINGDLILDPNVLGPKIEKLIPCLDPETNGHKHKHKSEHS